MPAASPFSYTTSPPIVTTAGSSGRLVDLPPGLLLEPVVVPALRHVFAKMTHVEAFREHVAV